MSRSKARADRIREQISITDVLAAYGYAVNPSGGDREQQFSCDLHGDGTDSKPSARVYPDTSQWYCFACATSRDAIQTVREKEGLDFRSACDRLEQRYHLPPLPWEGPDEDDARARSWEEVLDAPVATAADAQRRVSALLKSVTTEKSIPLLEVLRLWEEHDRLSTFLEKGSEGLLDAFLDLKERVVRHLRAVSVS